MRDNERVIPRRRSVAHEPSRQLGREFLDAACFWLGARSMTELADVLGVKRPFLSHVRAGRKRLPKGLVVRVAMKLRARGR